MNLIASIPTTASCLPDREGIQRSQPEDPAYGFAQVLAANGGSLPPLPAAPMQGENAAGTGAAGEGSGAASEAATEQAAQAAQAPAVSAAADPVGEPGALPPSLILRAASLPTQLIEGATRPEREIPQIPAASDNVSDSGKGEIPFEILQAEVGRFGARIADEMPASSDRSSDRPPAVTSAALARTSPSLAHDPPSDPARSLNLFRPSDPPAGLRMKLAQALPPEGTEVGGGSRTGGETASGQLPSGEAPASARLGPAAVAEAGGSLRTPTVEAGPSLAEVARSVMRVIDSILTTGTGQDGGLKSGTNRPEPPHPSEDAPAAERGERRTAQPLATAEPLQRSAGKSVDAPEGEPRSPAPTPVAPDPAKALPDSEGRSRPGGETQLQNTQSRSEAAQDDQGRGPRSPGAPSDPRVDGQQSVRAPEGAAPGSPPAAENGNRLPESPIPVPRGAAESMTAQIAPERPPVAGSGITIRLDPDNGLAGYVRVRVRGDAVQATFVANDRETAQRLGNQAGELQQMLRERGFSEAKVVIQASAPIGSPDAGNQREDVPSSDRPDQDRRAPNNEGREETRERRKPDREARDRREER